MWVLPVRLLVGREKGRVEVSWLKAHHWDSHASHHHRVVHGGTHSRVHAGPHAASSTAAHATPSHTSAHVGTHHPSAEVKVAAATHVIVIVVEGGEATSTHVIGTKTTPATHVAVAVIVVVKATTTATHVSTRVVSAETSARAIESATASESATSAVIIAAATTSSSHWGILTPGGGIFGQRFEWIGDWAGIDNDVLLPSGLCTLCVCRLYLMFSGSSCLLR